jgi:uncharacterized protein (TIRG00374 family)
MARIRQHVFAIFRTAFGLGLVVYLVVSGTIDGAALMGLAQHWPVAVVALGCVFGAVCLVSWRLCLLMQPQALHLSFSASLRLTLIGLFFNTCLPGATGGDIVRIYYAAKDNPGRRIEIVTIFLLDRVAGMFGILLLPLLLLPFFAQALASQPILQTLLWATAVGLSIVIIGMGCAMSARICESRVVSQLLQQIPRGQYLARVLATCQTAGSHPGSLGVSLIVSLGVHVSMTLATLLIVQVTHPEGVSLLMALLIPLGFVANALPLTPGGLGVGEAAFDQLFQLVGFSGGAVALLGWRLLMLLIGLPGLVVYIFAKQHAVAPQAAP